MLTRDDLLRRQFVKSPLGDGIFAVKDGNPHDNSYVFGPKNVNALYFNVMAGSLLMFGVLCRCEKLLKELSEDAETYGASQVSLALAKEAVAITSVIDIATDGIDAMTVRTQNPKPERK